MHTTAKRIQDIEEYYFSHKMREIQQMQNEGKKIINLGIGNPDLPPPPAVIKALTTAAKDKTKHGYQPYKGIIELREAMSHFYKRYYQVTLNPEDEILPLAGAKEGIMHISMAYLDVGDKVLIPNPGYTTYTNVTKILGATPLLYDLNEENNWLPDIAAIEKNDLSKVKIMWINYPNMPTGATADEFVFKQLIDFAKKHQILLVNDNPYSFILTDTYFSLLKISGAKETVLELNSLSKSYNMAGWRVGMLSGNKTAIKHVLKIKSNIDSGMFYGLQVGAIQALISDKQWFDKLNSIYKKRRTIIWKIADKIGATYQRHTVGFFVWAKLPKGKDSFETSDYLLREKHIFVTPGSIFGSNGSHYLRFSLCVPESVLLEVLKKL